MSSKRVIKKYPNRRLYDTAISSYVTLEDIKRLILDGVDVEVLDAKSQQDITHSTLLQIVVELESSAAPLFSSTVLERFIRMHETSGKGELQSELATWLSLDQSQVYQAAKAPAAVLA